MQLFKYSRSLNSSLKTLKASDMFITEQLTALMGSYILAVN